MEEQKFWTKSKIIFILVLIFIILLIVGLVYLNRQKDIKEYKKVEKLIESSAAPNYIAYENISLDDDEYKKININQIKRDNLLKNKYANDCNGYVIAESDSDSIKFKAYLNCKNLYVTNGYGKINTNKKQNKTKTQNEKDTKKPVITLLGSDTVSVNYNSKYEDKGATAIDNIDGDITNRIKVNNKVNTTKKGTYVVTYSVSDKAGNKAVKRRRVIVKSRVKKSKKDKTPPVLTFKNSDVNQKVCIGNKVDISQSGPYAYTAYDDVDKDITNNVKITGDINNATKEGEFTINYSIKDKKGNETKATRKYTVVNCSKPSTSTTPKSSINQTPSYTPTTPSTQAPSNPTPSNPTPTPTPTPQTPQTPSNPNRNYGGPVYQRPNQPTEIKVTRITAQSQINVAVGRSSRINASIEPSNATDKHLNYQSRNNSIANVDIYGNVSGIARGQTDIIISSTNGINKVVRVIVY